MNRSNVANIALVLACAIVIAPAGAAPTPVPGGADEKRGVSGSLSQVLFNGVLRLRGMSLEDGVPGDGSHANNAGDRAVVFRAIVSNGTHGANHGFFEAALADADGITTPGRELDDGWDTQPGAAARVAIAFSMPANFVPVRLILTQAAAPQAKVFRIALRPTDLSPAPASQ